MGILSIGICWALAKKGCQEDIFCSCQNPHSLLFSHLMQLANFHIAVHILTVVQHSVGFSPVFLVAFKKANPQCSCKPAFLWVQGISHQSAKEKIAAYNLKQSLLLDFQHKTALEGVGPADPLTSTVRLIGGRSLEIRQRCFLLPAALFSCLSRPPWYA